MRATATHFMLEATLGAYENGALARRREFDETIARDLMRLIRTGNSAAPC